MNFSDIPYAEKHYAENLADFYAVIMAIEKLEKAFHRDIVPSDMYEALLRRLMNKYKVLQAQLVEASAADDLSARSDTAGMGTEGFVPPPFDVNQFWSEYASKCTAARQRIRLGHPADVRDAEQAAATLASSQSASEAAALARSKGGPDPKLVLECGQFFITLMDCLKLQQTAVDQLFPILTDLVNALQKFAQARSVQTVASKLEGWLQRLNTMHPSDELSERDTREFAFDLERGYQTFYQYLSAQSGDQANV